MRIFEEISDLKKMIANLSAFVYSFRSQSKFNPRLFVFERFPPRHLWLNDLNNCVCKSDATIRFGPGNPLSVGNSRNLEFTLLDKVGCVPMAGNSLSPV